MTTDAQGYALTGASNATAARYDAAVRAFNLGYGDLLGGFDAALEDSPGFAMAQVGKAWIFALATDPGATAAARTFADAARGCPMDDRERGHLAALDLLLRGAPGRAADALALHSMAWPRDIMALEAGFLLDLFLGRSRAIRDRTARALACFPRDVPGHPMLLAFHAFGLEECGDYARAEDLAREAALLEPYGFWPHHTVAHVMEMQGRPEDGLGWMETREPFWSTDDHVTQTHIWWHRALFHVELGQYAAALALYDGPISATQRPLGVSLTNASALLWRLDLLGVETAPRWAALSSLWEGHADGRGCVFTDLHALMAELGAGRDAAADTRLATMRDTAASGGESGACYRDAGVPLAEGFAAFHRGQYARAADVLFPARAETWRIGGSHAQRDIVDWTLTEAALRGGLRDMAVALAHERLATRPRSAVNRLFLRKAEGLRA